MEISQRRSIVFVLSCYILWGILPIYWKQLCDVSAFYVLATRIVWSLVFCGLILLRKGQWHKIRTVLQNKRETGLLILSSLFICINWGCYIFAVSSDNILDASLAYYMNPIVSILLGAIVYREHLTVLQWCSVCIAAGGILVSLLWYGAFPWLALMIAISFALYGLVKKQVTSESEVSTCVEALFATPVSLVFIVICELEGTGAIGALQGWRFLLLPMAGVVTSVPLLFFAKGIKKTPLSLAGMLMYINPTIQLLLGLFLYHETITVPSLITFLAVWAAVILFLCSNLYCSRQARMQHPKVPQGECLSPHLHK